MLHPRTNPHVHVLRSARKLAHPRQPVLELRQRHGENQRERRSDRLCSEGDDESNNREEEIKSERERKAIGRVETEEQSGRKRDEGNISDEGGGFVFNQNEIIRFHRDLK